MKKIAKENGIKLTKEDMKLIEKMKKQDQKAKKIAE